MMRFSKSLLVPLVGLTMLGAQAARAEEPVSIRAAWIAPVTDIASILFAEPGIAKNNGKTYKYEASHYRGTPLEINALANGQLDMALLTFTSLSLAVENAGLKDLRIVIDESRQGHNGGYSVPYIVRKDSDIKKISDLKGKVVATNVIGSALGLIMKVGLAKNGINLKRDVNVIEAPFPTMKAVLLSGKADLVPSIQPFALDKELQAKSRVLFTGADAMGPYDLGIWVARKSFLDKNRAAVIDFMEDYLRAVNFYIDPKNREKAIDIAAKFTKLPKSVFEQYLLLPKEDIYRVPDGIPDTALIQKNIDTLYKYHLIKTRVDVANYIDASLIKEAGKRLKEQK
jgi:NitT/TauT family transport system substrate-binding protein